MRQSLTIPTTTMNALLLPLFLALTLALPLGLSAAQIHVSPGGDDDHPGSPDQPVATLQQAQRLARARIADGLDGPLTVIIHPGRYYLPDGLRFGPADSGTTEHPVTWMGLDGGEAPVLIGGMALTGWTPGEGNVRHAALPEGREPRQLFENGQALTTARHPETGYLELEEPVEGRLRQTFVYKAGDLDPRGWTLDDARVYIWPGHDWFSHDKPVTSIDPESRRVDMGTTSGYDMRPGNRYRIHNVPELIAGPGQCAIALSEGRVYAWPRDAASLDGAMVIPTASRLIEVRGEGGQPARHLRFQNLDLSISNGDGIRFQDAEDCAIRFCRIENGADHGVAITGRSQRVTVYGNLIQDHGNVGVQFSGPGAGSPEGNRDHVIENNHIRRCGQLIGHGHGIGINQSGHNRIVHNHIHSMPRYGISIKGQRFQVLRQQRDDVTWENRHDFLHSRNNTIAFNEIHRVNLDSQDTGAFEAWGPGRDNTLDNNLIYNVGNDRFDLQSGIYLDDAADYFTVTNNIIYGIEGTRGNQPIYAKGVGNRIENNILIVDDHCHAAIRSFFMADERADHHEYVRNIIYMTKADQGVYDFNNWSDDRVSISDHNVFFNAAGAPIRMRGRAPGDGDFASWRQALDGRFDAHSITEDPLFVDAANHDYRLQPESPALKLGFQPIDMSTVGLKDDFPTRFERR